MKQQLPGSGRSPLLHSKKFICILFFAFTAFSQFSFGQIVAWQFGSPASLGSEATYNATTNNANLNTSVLARGAGVTATALGRAFSANAWTNGGTKANAITNNQYFTFTISAVSGFQVSLSTLDARLRRSGATAPNVYNWQYSTDGTTFTDVGADISFTSTADGFTAAQINLSGISALQNVASGTTITLRLYAWGATAASSPTFAIGRFGTGVTTNSLAIGGTVTAGGSPTLFVNPSTLAFGNVITSTNSASQTDSLSGSSLTGAPDSITITAPSTDFQVSNDNTNWGPVTKIAYASATLSSTPFYVRFTPQTTGLKTGNVTLSGGGASTTVAVSGTGTNQFPTTPSTNLTFTSITTSSVVVGFTPGDGAKRIVVAHTGSTITYTPSNGTAPSGVNSNFSLATDQGSGSKIVYDGTGSSVTVTGLTAGETYYFEVYEYNGAGAGTFYLTSPFLAGNTTIVGPLYYSVTGSTYSQDFNGLPSAAGTLTPSGSSPYYLAISPINATNMNGWQFGQVGTPRFITGNGSGNTGGTYGFGTTSSSERALGSFASGSNTSFFGTVIQNNTGDVLTTVTISYAGEQWRRGDASANTLFFSYAVGSADIGSLPGTSEPSLNFTSPTVTGTNVALDGNDPANRTVVAPASFTLNTNWLPGQNLIIRWDDVNDGGNDDGMAIDSFLFSAVGPATPSVQDSSISFTNVSTFSMTANWLNGNGTNRIVIINTSNTFTDPVDGTSLPANSNYSGAGQQVIYNGPGSTVNVTGLSTGTTYFFRVYNYNGTDTVTRYNTATAFNNPNSQSTVAAAAPSQLVVTSVNGGISPSQDVPFYVVIRSFDASNYPQNVIANTNITITLNTGNGNLGGTLTGTILAGTNTDTIFGLTYDYPEVGVILTASVTSGDALASGDSPPFEVTGVATQLSFSGVPGSGIVNSNISSFSVQALKDNATLDVNYTGSITISIFSGPVGGIVSGTLTAAAVGGIATFSNIQFNLAGTYVLQADAAGLIPAFTNDILITNPPTLTELVVPQFMGSKTGDATNNARTPFVVCLTVDNLVPNTAYDVRMGLAIASDTITLYGAGNIWNASSIPPAYNANTILNAFTTDANGSSGPVWYYIQPTNNGTHFDAGQVHHVRMGFAINGNVVANSPSLFGTKTITALDIATTARTGATTDDGAFLQGSTSSCIFGKYILIYANTSGTGDPLFSYQARPRVDTNTSQSELPVSINDIYRQSGTSSLGDWPAVIPIGANNPNGVRRVEARNADNTIFNSATDADGTWPSGAATTTITRRSVAVLTLSDAGMSTVSISGISSTPSSCVGTNDGTATVTATGTGTLTYSWNSSPVQTTATATGLASGNYTVIVTDALGCSASASVTVNQPSASTITASGPTTFCNGDSVTLSAGAGADHYSWSTNPSTDTLQSIVVYTSGTYTVTVTTGTCIQTSLPVTVTVNNFSFSGPMFSENMGNPLSTTVVNSYSGWQNTSPVTFSSTTTNQSDLRTSLASSGYSGASGQGNVFMGTSGDNIRNFIISGINTSGYSNIILSFGLLRDNLTNGITVEVSSDGTTYSPLTISQPAVANTWTLTTASGVVPATANLRIRFSKSNSTSFRIDDVKLNVTLTSVSVTPAGPITNCGPGSVTLTSSIPTGNLWSPGNQTTQAIVVTSTGTYSVTVTDVNGCEATSSPVIVNFVPAVTVAITSTTPAGCLGGSATATVSGGTAPFSYSWNSSPVQTTATASGLPAGTYTVTVTDSNNCTATATTSIAQPAASTITPGGPTTFCNGGSVTLSAGSGVSYLWSTGATTQSIVVTTSGSYTVTVDDGLGCTQTSLPVVVTVNNFSANGTVFSENMGSGSPTTVVNSYTGWQNNAAPITFASTTTPSSDVRSSTPSTYPGASGAGNVFMNNTTSNSRDFIIAGINTLNYSNLKVSFGLRRDSGSDSITVETSTDGISYSPLLKVPGSTTWTVFTSTGSVPSTANLRVRFSKNSSSVYRIDDVKITGTTGVVTISSSGPTTICGPGSVTLTSNIPTGNLWSPGNETTQSITVSSNGTYSVTVTDTNGCQATSAPVNVQIVPAVTVAITSTTNASCNGFSDGSAVALASGGTAPINYSWNSVPVQTTATASNLAAGTYTVTVTDSNSCTATAATTITQPSAINLTATVSDSVVCAGDSVILSSTGTGVTFLTFANSTPVQIPDNNASGVTSSVVVSGLNILSLSDGLIANVKINSLTHTFDGNLVIRLVAPDGRYLTLSNHRGSGGDNFINTTFTPSATNLISAGSASFTGTFVPDTGVSASAAFSVFNGVDPNGTWQIFVSDNAAPDTGSLNSWSISFFNPIVFAWTSTPSGFSSSVQSPGSVLPSALGTGTVTYHVSATNNVTGCSVTSDVSVLVNTCMVTLDMNLFLQGYYSALGTSTPMDYQGQGGCLYIDGGIDGFPALYEDVDSIFVSLIDSTILANTFDYAAATFATTSGILQINGELLGLSFPASASGNSYFLKVEQRNHVEIWSAETQLMSAANTYNFTDDWSKAWEYFGNPFHAMYEMETGKWAMYVGDIFRDGFVDFQDIPELTTQIELAFPFGYLSGDLTGNGFIDFEDIPPLTTNIDYFGGIYSQHP